MNWPAFGLVVGSAIISAINPSSISVLVMMVASTLGQGKGSKRLLVNGLSFILSLFSTYLLLGLGTIYLLNSAPDSADKSLLFVISILAAFVGLIEIKDCFRYGRGLSMRVPYKLANIIHSYTTRTSGLVSSLLLGGFVAISLLPAVGSVYLATLAIIRNSNNPGNLAVFYNLAFVLPLLLILSLSIGGVKISAVIKWKEETKGIMRMFIGILLVLLSVILQLVVAGKVRFA